MMKSLTSLVCVVACSSPWAFAQEKQAVDIEARRQSIPVIEERIKERTERLTALASDIVRLDKRVESQIDQIVNKLASIKDSQATGRKISKLKMDAMEGLAKSAQRIQTQRAAVMRDLKATGDEGLKEEIDTFNQLAEKRVEQIIKISNSFTQDADVKKYESDEGYEEYRSISGETWYIENERISDEWKQNRRDRSMDKKQRDAVEAALKKSITRYESLVAGMENQLKNQNLSDTEKELVEDELQSHKEILATRKKQLTEISTATQPTDTASVGKEQAQDLEAAFDDRVSDLRQDMNTIRSKYAEFRNERSKLSELKKNLDDRKKWLEEYDKTNKP